jgi:hypothetical protein
MRKSGNYGDQNGKEKPPRKPNQVEAFGNVPFRGYINLALSDADKVNYDKWAASQSCWDALEAFVADGINISLKVDPKFGGFLATATQRRGTSVNVGLCVTARGRDCLTSLGRVLFCLTLLSRSERWEDTQPLADPDRW